MTASKQTGTSDGVSFVEDELAGLWEKSDHRKRKLGAKIELFFRKTMFPGHIGILWAFRAARRAQQIIEQNPKDNFVVLCSYPPLGVLLAGLLLKRRLPRRVQWIADFRDPIAGFVWTHTSALARWSDHRLENAIFSTASAIVANTDPSAAELRGRHPREVSKIEVIYNGFDPEDAPAALPIPMRNKRVLVHAGTLYEGRNPNPLLASLSRLRAKQQALDVQILLLGAVDSKAALDPKLSEQGEREGWLDIRPPVPKSEALRMVAEADGLLLLQPQSKTQVPGKLFEYICIGRPVLSLLPAVSPAAKILDECGVPFVCVYPEDASAVVDEKIVAFLALPPSVTAYSPAYADRFSAEQQAKQLVSIVERL